MLGFGLAVLCASCGDDGRASTIDNACARWATTAQALDAASAVRLDVRFEVTLPATRKLTAPQTSEYIVALSPGFEAKVAGIQVESLGPICGGQAVGYAIALAALTHDLTLVGESGGKTGMVVSENRRKRKVKSSSSSGGSLDFD